MDFDLILIGSGMGAMTVASLMARFRRKKILILERHYTPGGFTHSFSRKRKFTWDVGLQYVGNLQPGTRLQALFSLITADQVSWMPMPPLFEKFIYPDEAFNWYAEQERNLAALSARFPDEQPALSRYFHDVHAVNRWVGEHLVRWGRPAFIDRILSAPDIGVGTADLTTAQYLDATFRSPKLKAVLTSQWGNYGLPPGQSSFVIHCMIAAHYAAGGYYPVDGAQTLFSSVAPHVYAHGGEVKLGHEVEEILVEDDRAVGVRVRNLHPHGGATEIRQYRAPVIVSDAGAYNTYCHLIADKTRVPFLRRLTSYYERFPVVAHVALYLGFGGDPRELGFHGENHWFYSSYDHDHNFAAGRSWPFCADTEPPSTSEPPSVYLSFPSLKSGATRHHTAELIAPIDYREFAPWRAQSVHKRDEHYRALKERIAAGLLRVVERAYPGFSSRIEYQELSTPLSTEHYAAHPRGAVYGVACTTERFRSTEAPFCQAVSPIPGLFLTGADAFVPGIAGALFGGLSTLAHLPDGMSLPEVLRLSPAARPGRRPG